MNEAESRFRSGTDSSATLGAMTDEITRDDILVRLRALKGAAHRMDALLDQMEARGLALMLGPKSYDEGEALVAKVRQARSASKDSLVHWIESDPDISEDLVERIGKILDAMEGSEG